MQPTDEADWHELMRLIDADDGPAVSAWLDRFPDAPAPILFAVDPTDDLGRTPLMLAYWRGKPAAAKAIVNAGANYEQQDASGRNASWYARRFGKGDKEAKMARAIRASFRRMSMEEAIGKEMAKPKASEDSGSEAPPPPPKRRGRDV